MSLFTPVDQVLSAYSASHGLTDVPIKVDLIKPIIESIGCLDTIYFEELHLGFDHIIARITTHEASAGVYAGNGTYARIQVAAGQPPFLRRFAFCKEMYQCILDATQKNKITNTDELLRLGDHFTSTLLDAIADEQDEERFPPFDTDNLAVLMAVETLFPIELRRTMFDQFDNGEVTIAQLAIRFQVPEEVVEIGMTNESLTSAVLRGRKLIDI